MYSVHSVDNIDIFQFMNELWVMNILCTMYYLHSVDNIDIFLCRDEL